ncbi:MAG: hypothetical protein FGF53_10475 [Candidatus Brockarchaeota archaeon]|nr:hypothetical protein [Candidatus Brockarchaeota archaeon]
MNRTRCESYNATPTIVIPFLNVIISPIEVILPIANLHPIQVGCIGYYSGYPLIKSGSNWHIRIYRKYFSIDSWFSIRLRFSVSKIPRIISKLLLAVILGCLGHYLTAQYAWS